MQVREAHGLQISRRRYRSQGRAKYCRGVAFLDSSFSSDFGNNGVPLHTSLVNLHSNAVLWIKRLLRSLVADELNLNRSATVVSGANAKGILHLPPKRVLAHVYFLHEDVLPGSALAMKKANPPFVAHCLPVLLL